MSESASRGRWQVPLAWFVGIGTAVTIAWTVIETLWF
jgi:hypothetical protein